MWCGSEHPKRDTWSNVDINALSAEERRSIPLAVELDLHILHGSAPCEPITAWGCTAALRGFTPGPWATGTSKAIEVEG
jgi:hypothetical protein